METMKSSDSALRGTAATPELWGAAYIMLAFALLSRSLHAWERLAAGTDQLLPIAIPTIERLGGGSVRCMLAEVFSPT